MFVVLSSQLVNTVFISDTHETVVTSTGQETVLRAFRYSQKAPGYIIPQRNSSAYQIEKIFTQQYFSL